MRGHLNIYTHTQLSESAAWYEMKRALVSEEEEQDEASLHLSLLGASFTSILKFLCLQQRAGGDGALSSEEPSADSSQPAPR